MQEKRGILGGEKNNMVKSQPKKGCKYITLELSDSMYMQLIFESNDLRCSPSDLTDAIFLKYFWWNDEALKILKQNSKKPLN